MGMLIESCNGCQFTHPEKLPARNCSIYDSPVSGPCRNHPIGQRWIGREAEKPVIPALLNHRMSMVESIDE